MEKKPAHPKQHKKPLIVITGFGPFKGHEKVNASWEAVRLLPNMMISARGIEYTLESQMISVEYNACDQAVNNIWKRKPRLVVHCGVHGQAKCVHIEKLAYNHKFDRPDYKGALQPKGTACLMRRADVVIASGLDVDRMVLAVNEACTNCTSSADIANVETTKASNDVGNYLCGYIYLKSLDRNRNRSLFVHVPPIDKPFSSSRTAEILLKIINECVRQLEEKEEAAFACVSDK